jgi:hypothetical protein
MRLIKIDDVIKKLNDAERRMDMKGFYRISVEIRSICSAIKRLPTIDAEPVVRCKDCKQYNTTGCSEGLGWCESMDRGVHDDFYCSCGAKMDKED